MFLDIAHLFPDRGRAQGASASGAVTGNVIPVKLHTGMTLYSVILV